MSSNRQYNKYVLRILVVLLPTLVLNLNLNTTVTEDNYEYSDRNSFNSLNNINKPFYYLNYFTSIALLPEEESVATHFIRAATRYFQYPQRFFYYDLYSSVLSLLNVSLFSYLVLILFKKQINDTSELAVHIGGHAPPCMLS
ncbi:hypothetical protein Ana3638_11045 [Anaerocolumna sedimenticola]|uniref:Uncharacterized protein n=1 Tax=Anaerocolumna sedimenticola TaxID=2696063 RepID=A0A6P1TM69_9FIRM|nr:hypothetical protein [Anaerocolumna sedimenticola]QHQ61242.1 hypothetical protein Ana3638_11045 [Anaerocolumna sedimenticola]